MESKETKNISAELGDKALESVSAGSVESLFGISLEDPSPESLE